MTIVARADSHVTIDDKGVARIDGTRMKVIDVAKAIQSHSPSVEKLLEAFPDLGPAQIHAALAYYYDHQSAMDTQIRQEASEFDQARAAAADTPGRAKLRQQHP